jgi:Domain of unknown function (DUF5060)/Protein of unknown function (DUF4038)
LAAEGGECQRGCTLFLRHMRQRAVCRMAVLVLLTAAFAGAAVPSCTQAARTFAPCELSYEWQEGEVAKGASAYRDELLNIEFRSPRHITYLMRAFWDGGHTLRVRFSPMEEGVWTYHTTSDIKRYENQEGTFTVADAGAPGFVSVANVRHWRTTNKQPHLWLAVSAPFLNVETAAMEQWLDARKHDGFTHIRGPLLTLTAGEKPLASDGQPNLAYFRALDERVLAADTRGFALDLLLADESFVKSGALNDWKIRDPLVRYLIARYGGLDVTWQGIEHFEDTQDARQLLKELGTLLQKNDAYQHPRSTDARVTSSPLGSDGWMNYLIEASADPQLAAVEHQFTQQPEIHIIDAIDPEAFRHELWNATTNGEYPSVPYEAMKNDANVKAVRTWLSVVADTRHWELEPYFGVDGARAVGLEEVEYLAYAEKPGIVEVTLPKHKYNPVWVNPISGEEIPLKDYKGEVFSRQTPDAAHDWVLTVPREGHKESMLKSYYFESQEPPVQEPELDNTKIPFDIAEPAGEELNRMIPVPFQVKITKPNRATRRMQYVWWGEVVVDRGDSPRTGVSGLAAAAEATNVIVGEGARVLGLGASGNLAVAQHLTCPPGSNLTLRLLAINANGKAYELDRVYRLTP